MDRYLSHLRPADQLDQAQQPRRMGEPRIWTGTPRRANNGNRNITATRRPADQRRIGVRFISNPIARGSDRACRTVGVRAPGLRSSRPTAPGRIHPGVTCIPAGAPGIAMGHMWRSLRAEQERDHEDEQQMSWLPSMSPATGVAEPWSVRRSNRCRVERPVVHRPARDPPPSIGSADVAFSAVEFGSGRLASAELPRAWSAASRSWARP